MALTFRRADRLTRRSQFERCLRQGAAGRDGALLVRAARNELGRMRLGFRVPRSYGDAVERNRARRVLREAFRLSRAALAAETGGLDLVVAPRRGAAPDLAAWTESLGRCVRQAAARLGRET